MITIDHLTREQVEGIIKRLRAGGCCGLPPAFNRDDLKLLNLEPLPATYDSMLGIRIVPASGWKALMVYMAEKLSGKPIAPEYLQAQHGMEPKDPGHAVADLLDEMLKARPDLIRA